MATQTDALARKLRLKQLVDDACTVDSQIAQRSSVEILRAVDRIISTSDDINAEGSFQERAGHSTEVVMDAQVLKMGHELVSKVLQQSSDFNDGVYQNAITALVYRSEDVKWHVIADIACNMARTVRVQSSMLGAIESELHERVTKQRQQRKRTVLAAEKRPSTIDKLTRQDKGAQKVNIVHKQLRDIFKQNGRQPIPYFKLVIDPLDFMNTVENTFQLAFLARDNIIGIETGEDGYPQVRLATADERKEEQETSQSMCTLNAKMCREMIYFYNIREAMLPAQPTEIEQETDNPREEE